MVVFNHRPIHKQDKIHTYITDDFSIVWKTKFQTQVQKIC